MKFHEPKSLKDLLSFLERRKERYKEGLEVCEEALKTLKHPKHIEIWESERDSIKDSSEEIERKLALYRLIAA